MSMSLGFGIYNTYKQMIKSCSGYQSAFKELKKLEPNTHIEVEYLFIGKKTIRITPTLYIQRFWETGGGIQPFGDKYYFNLNKIRSIKK